MKFTSDSVTLSKAEVKALVAHCSKDVIRPHVNSLYINFEDGHAATTDGHRLALFEAKTRGGLRKLLVPRDACVRALKLATGKHDVLRFVDDEIEVLETMDGQDDTVPTTKGRVVFKPVEAQFPNYQPVIPTFPNPDAVPAFCVNSEYLKDVILVAQAVNVRCPQITGYAPATPIEAMVLEAKGPDGRWLVVIMPIRTDELKGLEASVKYRNDLIDRADAVILNEHRNRALEAELRTTLEAVKTKIAEDAVKAA